MGECSEVITIKLDNVYGRIESGILPMEVANIISRDTSYEVAGAEFMKRGAYDHRAGKFRPKYGGWDGSKKLYNRGTRKFPAGLFGRIVGILEHHNVEYRIEWGNIPHELFGKSLPVPDEWTLRPYQTDAVSRALAAQRCMIRVATGGGKTVMAGHMIAKVGRPAVFFVHTKDLLYQAIDCFRSMFPTLIVGQVGDGVCVIGDVTICTLQTAAKALDCKYERDPFAEGDESWQDGGTMESADDKAAIRRMLNDAEVLFMDECHRVAAPTAVAVVEGVPNAYYRFGLSASPWRDDGADLVLEGAFGHVEVDISASELIDRGFLVQPYIRMMKGPIGRFTKQDKYATVYDQYVVNNDRRNAIGISEAKKLMGRGLSTLVLVRQIAHGEAIAEALREFGNDIPFLSGKDSSTHRQTVLNDLRADRLAGLVATSIADEGLDVKPLAGLVLLGAGKSSTRALQRVGRVLRPYPGKTHAEVIDFEDNAKYLYDHSRARLKIYETEPNFIITDV